MIIKALIATIYLLLFVVVSNGQNETSRIFQPFRVDLSAGLALPLGGGADNNGGAFGSMEPKYAFSDKFALGLRWETAWLERTSKSSAGKKIGKGQGNMSITFTGDYYLNTNKFRPYIGGGAGYNAVDGATIVDKVTTDSDFETAFGYLLRVGFEAGLFRFGVEYNGISATNSSPDNSYIGFKLSGLVGGNRIKR